MIILVVKRVAQNWSAATATPLWIGACVLMSSEFALHDPNGVAAAALQNSFQQPAGLIAG
jgi:hypothetical protein